MTHEQKIKLTLLLLYLNSWEEKEYGQSIRRAWKGPDFDSLNKLEEDGFITQSKTAKSLYLTEEGINAAKELENLLATINIK
ncbi:MAG TPA: DUF6429 family protein [Panacibacter sp.]|nr:DUF6429 family protein [Panacibacter sp.]